MHNNRRFILILTPPVWPNLPLPGMAFLQVYLEQTMFSLLVSSRREPMELMLEKITDYDVVGFSCFKSNFPTTLRLIQVIKKRKPSIRIILGGPYFF
jgi:radical SAM superfamily enzyme YgiQ (UPF0313 family)